MKYNTDRFIEMHELYYEVALNEIRDGHKRSHWMWFIFPQLKGLGHSAKSDYYGISCVEEVREYMSNEYLKNNTLEICNELLNLNDDIDNIFDYPDNLKLKSSMTLFEYALPEEKVFKSIIDKFYNSEKDETTINLLNNN